MQQSNTLNAGTNPPVNRDSNGFFTKPMGGSEIVFTELFKRIPSEILEKYDFCIVPRLPDKRKITVLYCQCSYDDSNWAPAFKDKAYIDQFDFLIFVSHWQFEKFRQHFNIPESKCFVLKNAINPIEQHLKPANGKIRLIYTSTPHRGLDVLVDSFVLLNRADVELEIYSSFKLYGRAFEQAEKQFQPLYDYCKTIPNIHYHGSVSNEEIREALKKAHIFAYPCIFEETFCVSLAEAMSAGCWPIISNIGALPETSADFGTVYEFIPNKRELAKRFAGFLTEIISKFYEKEYQEKLKKQVEYASYFHSWDYRMKQWEHFFIETQKKL